MHNEVNASIKKNDNIYICDEIKSPFILGIIRPRIYLPSGMSEEVSKNVVAHEKEHIAGYSQVLLTCAAQRRMITACPIAFGETDVKGRIGNVLNYKKPAFWIICISIA